MSIELHWYGHGTWLIEAAGQRILLDPFLDESPTAPVKAADVEVDCILVSHGHFDHIADAASIAKRCQATVVAIFEIAQWLAQKHGVENTVGMNIGGQTQLPFGSVKLTQAFHSSQLPDGSYGGEPAGFILSTEGRKIYFACDTGLFSDMQLIGAEGIDVAVLPIGDLFTMGPQDSVRAAQWVQAKNVLPAHYNTWPPIEQDAAAWSQLIQAETSSVPVVLQPGEAYTV